MIVTIKYAANLFLDLLQWAIFIEVLLSWVVQGRENKFTQIIKIFTEPLMAPARKVQEKIVPGLMVDFSPVFALLIISLLRSLIFRIL